MQTYYHICYMHMCRYHTYMDTTCVHIYIILCIKRELEYDGISTALVSGEFIRRRFTLVPLPFLLLAKLMVRFFYYCNCDGIQLGMEACFQDPNRNSIVVNPVSLSMEDFFLLAQKQNPST